MVVAICDDDLVYIERLKQQLMEIPYIEKILTYSNYEVLLADIRSFVSPDLAIMDMEWNRERQKNDRRHSQRENGMVLAENLLNYSPKTQILYVTGYLDYFAQRMFLHEANVIGLLRKPVDSGLLKVYLDRVRNMLEEEENKDKYLILKKRHESINVRHEGIRYMESENHVVHVKTDKLVIDVSQSLESLQEKLPNSFVRCHKSYVVNLEYVTKVGRSGVQIVGRESEIPVGRRYYDEMRRKFMLRLSADM